ncbi:MAG: CheR family methyltransferase [Stagnimonas sp.]|nr:CheR family methyltransferase [Stagnimonas sp.]
MSPDLDTRQYAYAARDFERVRRLIHSRAGIALADSKQDMVYSRLVRRLRATGSESFQDYLDRLEQTGDAEEWQAFTNALTTNLTSFFRESHHFDSLAELLRARPRGERSLLWSAAASTGEEPYSIAMTAVEAYGSMTPPVIILATDIDTQVLATAERGIYPLERLEKLSAERKRRFFRRGTGANAGHCRVVDELRALIRFRPLNLLDAQWPIKGPFQAIFCRNVMIYFDKPTQLEIIGKLVPRLAPDGLLYAGHSESFFHAAHLIRPLGRTIYTATGSAARPASARRPLPARPELSESAG